MKRAEQQWQSSLSLYTHPALRNIEPKMHNPELYVQGLSCWPLMMNRTYKPRFIEPTPETNALSGEWLAEGLLASLAVDAKS